MTEIVLLANTAENKIDENPYLLKVTSQWGVRDNTRGKPLKYTLNSHNATGKKTRGKEIFVSLL